MQGDVVGLNVRNKIEKVSLPAKHNLRSLKAVPKYVTGWCPVVLRLEISASFIKIVVVDRAVYLMDETVAETDCWVCHTCWPGFSLVITYQEDFPHSFPLPPPSYQRFLTTPSSLLV